MIRYVRWQIVIAVLGLLLLIALLGYLIYLNWQLTLIVAIMVPGVAWIMKTLSRRLYRITKTSQQATDDLAYVVEENVLAHRMVRLHGAQAQEARRFEQLSLRLKRLASRGQFAQAGVQALHLGAQYGQHGSMRDHPRLRRSCT